MDRISGFNFSYERIGFNNFRCFITNLESKDKFFIDFQNNPNFGANNDTNKQIFAEFIKNGKSFTIDIQSEVIKGEVKQEILEKLEENKV